MGQPYVGEIRMFAGNFAPAGWMLCQGQTLAISEFETLFNLIGTTYGGDGQSTFALPNLQSRVPMHQGSGFTLAQMAGEEQVTLTNSQIPSHSHAALANTTPGGTSPSGAVWAGSTDVAQFAPPAQINGQMNSQSVGPAGGNQPHDNMVPFVGINFIISLFGVFPTQS